ncbi:hypothetical protein Sfulv_61940 [Streptomyces fulvorobeus]|uniref:Uncharacterized protein n=1 Tax=Streptomyces fulvorobeus TaxID=284028 RepID=A0A7J0CHH3_9ACTN|nr:hypothetical protein Sfulv_61940 [Streptomyces fulvorobeus]
MVTTRETGPDLGKQEKPTRTSATPFAPSFAPLFASSCAPPLRPGASGRDGRAGGAGSRRNAAGRAGRRERWSGPLTTADSPAPAW